MSSEDQLTNNEVTNPTVGTEKKGAANVTRRLTNRIKKLTNRNGTTDDSNNSKDSFEPIQATSKEAEEVFAVEEKVRAASQRSSAPGTPDQSRKVLETIPMHATFSPTKMDKGIAKSELHSALLGLYDSDIRGEDLDQIILAYYEKDCEFEDPLVKTYEIKDFRAQFAALRTLFASCKVVEHNFLSEGNFISFESVVAYRPWLSPFTLNLRQISKITVHADSGKIQRHEDLWSFESMIMSVPFVSYFYSTWRDLSGYLISNLCHLVQDKFEVNKNG
eukprot:Clim_evm56s151 gene=Clim_evmTU56s151